MAILEQPLHLKSAYLEFSGDRTPDVSPAGMARIFYDRAANQLKTSLNGAAYSVNANALSLADLSAHVLTTAPPASASAGLMRFDDGALPFSGSAAGTYLAMNSAAAFAGTYLHFQDNQADVFAVWADGGVVSGGTTLLGQGTFYAATAARVGLVVRGAASQTANMAEFRDNSGTARVALSDFTTVGEHLLTLRAIDSQTGHFLTCVSSDGLSTIYAFEQTGAGHYASFAIGGATKLREQTVANGGADRLILRPKGNIFDVLNEAGNAFMAHFATSGAQFYSNGTARLTVTDTALTLADAVNIAVNTTTGTKIGTVGGAAGQKLAFWNSTPIVQPVLATGGGATVDNVITVLQNLGLCRQS